MMRRGNTLIIIAVVAAVLAAGELHSKDIIIHGNEFTDSYNIALNPITASIGGYVYGLDYPGEWVEYQFSTNEFGTSSTYLTVQGQDGVSFHLQLSLRPFGVVDEQLFEFVFTGVGFG